MPAGFDMSQLQKPTTCKDTWNFQGNVASSIQTVRICISTTTEAVSQRQLQANKQHKQLKDDSYT